MPLARRRRQFRAAALAVFLTACAGVPLHARLAAHPNLAARSAAAQHALGVFPPMQGEALDKTLITLPGQLQGTYNLLLLSWARDQGSQVNSWTAVSQAVEHTFADTRAYRMPVSAPENGLFRWWDNSSMRTDETDPDSLHWTVPLYTDKQRLRRSLGVPADDQHILILLVDRSGRVLWRAQGASTEASRESLMAAAQQLHGGSGQSLLHPR